MRGRGIPRRAEVDQFDLLIFGQKDVVRRYVTVDNARLMYHLKGLDHRRQHLDGLLHRNFTLSFQVSSQGFSIQKLHDDISGIVRLKAVVDTHDSRLVLEFGQAFRLIDKLGHTIGKLLRLIPGEYGHLGLAGSPGRELAGEIFLDGHALLEYLIPGDVSDAEAAVTYNLSNKIPLCQNGAWLHM